VVASNSTCARTAAPFCGFDGRGFRSGPGDLLALALGEFQHSSRGIALAQLPHQFAPCHAVIVGGREKDFEPKAVR
jgi:hypothetical protein